MELTVGLTMASGPDQFSRIYVLFVLGLAFLRMYINHDFDTNRFQFCCLEYSIVVHHHILCPGAFKEHDYISLAKQCVVYTL